MKANLIQLKSMNLAIEVVKIYKHLMYEKKEFVLSKQLLRSGTSVGAMIREAKHAESKADFIHKFSIAQKELNETIYWIELMCKTNFLDRENVHKLDKLSNETMRILTSIIKSTKANMNQK